MTTDREEEDLGRLLGLHVAPMRALAHVVRDIARFAKIEHRVEAQQTIEAAFRPFGRAGDRCIGPERSGREVHGSFVGADEQRYAS